MITLELEDGDAALIVRANGDQEVAVPDVDDEEEIPYDSPTAMVIKAHMALNDAEILTKLQDKFELELVTIAKEDQN